MKNGPIMATLDKSALDTLFRAARTHVFWTDVPVPDDTLRELYELMAWGPTSGNCLPTRLVFLRTAAAKERLRPALSPGNLDKTMAAPVTAILGLDMQFHEHLPRLFPNKPDSQNNYLGDGKTQLIYDTALRNGSLQGGYFILAARALGLDCGPMGGFSHDGIDAEFFADTQVKSNFLCNLGYGAPGGTRPRNERLGFDEACKIL
jgi:3-hydroxypropanoate dehydrogenase